MAPWHVTTFQKFEAQIPNRLEASIAFGLFMESVKQWATREGDPPDGKYRKYQDALTDYEIGRYAQEARNFLNKATRLLQSEPNFCKKAWSDTNLLPAEDTADLGAWELSRLWLQHLLGQSS